MMASSAQIEKLCGDNYASWSVHMRSLLITLDYWYVVEGICSISASAEEKASWKSTDLKALATITLGIKPSELIHVKKCKTAKEAWEKLCNIYVAKSPARKVNLFKKLVRFKMQDTLGYQQQINEFCGLVESLKEVDVSVPDDFISILLLCSLPEEYDSFVVAMESRDKLPSLDHLKVKIVEEHYRRGEKTCANDEHIFAANSKRRDKYKTKSNDNERNDDQRYKNVRCYSCGKRGHIKANCKNRYSDNSKSMVMSIRDESYSCSSDIEWIVDSGASSHMSSSKSLFSSLRKHSQKVILASGDCVYAEGIGNVNIKSEYTDITLCNVLFVPKLNANFLSVHKIIEHGNELKFTKEKAFATSRRGNMIFEAQSVGGIFLTKLKATEHVMMATGDDDNVRWHSRLGHLNYSDMLKLQKFGMVRGLQLNTAKTFSCMTCAMCKMTVQPFPKYGKRFSKNQLELVHSDICGPMRVTSAGGARYFITFVDDYSRFTTVYFLKKKSEALKAFKDFQTMAERQTGLKLKVLRSDNGSEYKSNDFQKYLSSAGIEHQTTVCYTPQQNGIAERINRTLVEMVRCMLLDSDLPKSLWSEALNTAAYLRNRCPTKVLKDKTPYEYWFDRKPTVAHLRSFGSFVVALDKKPGRSKLNPKGKKLRFVGYAHQTKAYRLYDEERKSIIIARDVVFFESQLKELTTSNDGKDKGENHDYFNVDVNVSNNEIAPFNLDISPDEEVESEDSIDNFESVDGGEKRRRGRPRILRMGRVGRPRKMCLMEEPETVNELQTIDDDPKSVKEAMNSNESIEWKRSMKEEFENLQRNNTWKLVEKPINKNVIGSKWVFVKKKGPTGKIEKYKSRLVAQGFAQKFKVDYNQTYSPVVRYSAIRMLLAIAAQKKLLVNHVDVVSAYLNSELQEDVYMKQPEMFVDENYPDHVCKLNKSIYGLKQAGRDWYWKINKILIDLNFERSKTDNCLYVLHKNDDDVYLAVYVDDILIACSHDKTMKEIISSLNRTVDAIDRGPVKFYLGMEIKREGLRGPISITQSKYIRELLEEWQMTNCKPSHTPFAAGTVLNKCTKEDCNGFEVQKYQSLIGSLMYLSVISRPDISHIVSKLAQFSTHPEKEHFVAAKHVLRYLKKNTNRMLTYKNNNRLVCYTDADWGSDALDRKSYSGFVVYLAGGPITWESKKQKIVSLSSMEAEYISMCQGTKEIIYLRSLLTELKLESYISIPTNINCDNQSAQFLVQNPSAHK